MKFQISYPIEYILKWMIYEALFSERDKRAYILFAIDGGATIYKIGKEVKPNKFDYIPNQCSSGIHYFYDRKMAETYVFT